MKKWFSKNYKTLIIAAFLIPILTVAIVSISHVTEWYGLSNPVTWAVYLSIGIEIAALSALAAISANMGSKIYFPFAIVTLVQFIGNIFFAYSYIDIDTKQFKDWVDLVAPLVEFMGVDQTDYVGHKRFLALFSGGMLPLISLSFLHMLVKFTEEDRKNGERIVFEEEKHLVDDKIIQEAIEKYKKEQEVTTPEDLKEFVDEVTRVRLSDEDLKLIESVLLNPPPPNEKLKEASEKYKETQKESLIEIMKNDEELGLYGESIIEEQPIIEEEPLIETKEIVDEVEIPVVTEMTQLQKLEDFVNPIVENIEVVDEVIFREEVKPEFEIPEQEGWTEEMEQRYWESQEVEPIEVVDEVEKFKIDPNTINNPTQEIHVEIDENSFKPFDVNVETVIEESPTERFFEITPVDTTSAEKKNL